MALRPLGECEELTHRVQDTHTQTDGANHNARELHIIGKQRRRANGSRASQCGKNDDWQRNEAIAVGGQRLCPVVEPPVAQALLALRTQNIFQFFRVGEVRWFLVHIY